MTTSLAEYRTSATHQKLSLRAALATYVVVSAVSPYLYGPKIAGVMVIGLLFGLLSKPMVDNAGILWTLALTCLGLASTLHGVLNDNPGAIPQITVFVFEPLLLGIFMSLLVCDPRWQQHLKLTLDLALIAVAIVGCAVYVAAIAGFSLPKFLVNPKWAYADNSAATLRTNFQGYNAFVFLGAYGLWRARDITLGAYHKTALLLSALSGIVLSGRRILYLVVPLSLILLVAVTRRVGARQRLTQGTVVAAAGALLGMAVVTTYIEIGPIETIRRMLGQFTIRGEHGDARRAQSTILLDEWAQSPLVGHGSGHVIPDYSRNQDSPWAFELSYHSLLMSMGLIGTAVMLGWGLWILKRLLTKERLQDPFTSAVLAGYLSTCLATSVDPYVQKMDGMWMLFIPFAAALAQATHRPTTEEGLSLV